MPLKGLIHLHYGLQVVPLWPFCYTPSVMRQSMKISPCN